MVDGIPLRMGFLLAMLLDYCNQIKGGVREFVCAIKGGVRGIVWTLAITGAARYLLCGGVLDPCNQRGGARCCLQKGVCDIVCKRGLLDPNQRGGCDEGGGLRDVVCAGRG